MGIDPESRAEEIFAEALEKPRDERTAYLGRRCGDDVALRVRVDALLQAYEKGHGVFGSEGIPKRVREVLKAAADGPAADSGVMNGQQLSHYRLVEKIGEGGMGVVWKAEDTVLNRTVAIKVLPADALADDQARKRFLREAKTLSQLNHPHVATVFDFGSQDGVDFLIMEYVEGTTLAHRLQQAALPVEELLRIGREVGEALAEAHENGIVHRDLKPGNIGLTSKGQVKVLDFGLAKVLRPAAETATTESLTATPALAGTLPYMAPEQLRGDLADHRCDLYALGVVMYEMATGRRPFQQTSAAALAGAILHQPPEQPRRLKTDLPLRLEMVILKCLAKDPNRRYQTAHELLLDLRRVDTTTIGIRARRLLLRWPSLLVFVLLAALVGLNVGGLRRRLFGPGESVIAALLILPLEVRGQGDGAEYVGRAFAEALAVNLAQRQDLKILAVPQTGELGGKTRDRARMARGMGAELVLEGALTREGDTIEAGLSLLDTEENRILWGTTKKTSADGLSAMGSLLATEVANRLGADPFTKYDYYLYASGSAAMAASTVFAEARGAIRTSSEAVALETTQRLVEAFPNEPDAHTLRVVALAWATRGMDESSSERKAFDAALAELRRIDPQNPWADDRYAYVHGYGTEDHVLPAENVREAVEIWTRILQRSDLTPAAQASLLAERADFEFGLPDLPSAFADLDEALRLDPANDYIFCAYSNVALRSGHMHEALTRGQQAVALNPSSGINNLYLGRALYFLGRYDESLGPLAKACEADWNCGDYGSALSMAGRSSEALSLLSKPCSESKRYCGKYAIALIRAGMEKEARAVMDNIFSTPQTYGHYRGLAAFHCVSGNQVAALEALRRSYELSRTEPLGLANTLVIAYDPDFSSLHGNPEFEAIVADLRKRWGIP